MLEVDMMAEARNAQLAAAELLGPGALKVVAPAKVNLFLAIGEQRADGYHDLVSVFHALALHDTLHFKREPLAAASDDEATSSQQAIVGPARNLHVTVYSADKTQPTVRPFDMPAADNLVVRAIDALAKRIGYNADERILVHIEKHIPAQAGLGGGSSNAAAALLAAARFWGVAPDGPTLRDVAATLGADIAFFLEGGCALMEGTGERLETRLEPAKLPVVLVKLDEGVSTAQAYARFDEDPTPVPADLLAQAEDAKLATEVPLFNNLAPAAESLAPELAAVRMWLGEQLSAAGIAQAADSVLLCGSGSCTFAIADSFAQASAISAAATAHGWWSRPTTLSSLKATIA